MAARRKKQRQRSDQRYLWSDVDQYAESVVSFAKDDLSFVKQPPDLIEIECSICFSLMLTEPQLVTCCGRHFCGPCLWKVKRSHGACPMCKARIYQSVTDKDRLRIINGLQVYCTNRDGGCEWKGELKGLSTHLNRGVREGECQFEVVQCRHESEGRRGQLLHVCRYIYDQHCEIKAQRCHLHKHEMKECHLRPYRCQYCGHNSIYSYVTDLHHKVCCRYPVPCPNGCEQELPRTTVDTHCDKECPLQPVECEFNWASCSEKVLRKDLTQHASDNHLKHMSLLAKACGELKVENEVMKKENNLVIRKCEELRRECGALRQENQTVRTKMEVLLKDREKMATTQTWCSLL